MPKAILSEEQHQWFHMEGEIDFTKIATHVTKWINKPANDKPQSGGEVGRISVQS